MLVNLLHTLGIERELVNGKQETNTLIIRRKHPLSLEKSAFKTFWIYYLVSCLLWIFAVKIILGLIVKIGPECIEHGDFSIPALCYNLFLPQWKEPVNCNTWKPPTETGGGTTKPLLCFSLYFEVLTMLSEALGLYGMYSFILLTYLSLALSSCRNRCCDKKHFCIPFPIRFCIFMLLLYGILSAIFVLFYFDIFTPGDEISFPNGLFNKVFLLFFTVVHSILLGQVLSSGAETDYAGAATTDNPQQTVVSSSSLQIKGETTSVSDTSSQQTTSETTGVSVLVQGPSLC
jgi:hypothetical protein